MKIDTKVRVIKSSSGIEGDVSIETIVVDNNHFMGPNFVWIARDDLAGGRLGVPVSSLEVI